MSDKPRFAVKTSNSDSAAAELPDHDPSARAYGQMADTVAEVRAQLEQVRAALVEGRI